MGGKKKRKHVQKSEEGERSTRMHHGIETGDRMWAAVYQLDDDSYSFLVNTCIATRI